MAALSDDDARDLGRALATGEALAWVRAQGEDPPPAEEGTPATREARYRTERNAAREQVTALTERVQRLQRAEVERLAGAKLAAAADLWTVAGVQPADLLTDDGAVDPAKVDAATRALLDTRPGLARGAALRVDFGQGQRGGQSLPEGASWSQVLRPQPS